MKIVLGKAMLKSNGVESNHSHVSEEHDRTEFLQVNLNLLTHCEQ